MDRIGTCFSPDDLYPPPFFFIDSMFKGYLFFPLLSIFTVFDMDTFELNLMLFKSFSPSIYAFDVKDMMFGRSVNAAPCEFTALRQRESCDPFIGKVGSEGKIL